MSKSLLFALIGAIILVSGSVDAESPPPPPPPLKRGDRNGRPMKIMAIGDFDNLSPINPNRIAVTETNDAQAIKDLDGLPVFKPELR
jgi:hypothetical protein